MKDILISKYLLIIFLLISCLLLLFIQLRSSPQSSATKAGSRHLIVISVDALHASDLEAIKKLPNFKMLMDNGAYAQEVVGVYPSLTYPSHTSVLTGTNPDKHGIYNNELFQPGVKEPEWYWYAKDIQQLTLCDLAKQEKMKVGAIFWPVLAGAKIDYNCPEIWPVKGQNQILLSLTSGTPLFTLNMYRKFSKMLDGQNQPNLDNFSTAAASWLIREKRPNLVLLHLTDTDSQRHRYGFKSDEVTESMARQDLRIGQLIEAAREAGIYDNTTFVVLGDHGFLDVDYKINLNIALRQAGLITVDSEGKVIDWKAYANGADGSAQIVIKDKEDLDSKQAVATILQQLKEDPLSGLEQIYNREGAAQKGVAGYFDYMVEAKEGYYFVNNWWGQEVTEIIEQKIDGQDKKAGYAATHGYDPLKTGYRTLFLACGAGVKPGVILPTINLIDEGPTLANFLGLSLSGADGRLLNEILADN